MTSPNGRAQKPGFHVAKVERDILHERAYLELKKAIMSGAIRPGAKITIRAMAAALGTSPMPVREALRRLVAERALELSPSRTVTLPLIAADRFDEICRLRIAVEGLVTETAAAVISSEDLRRMEQIQAGMVRLKPQRTAEFLGKNQALHFTLYQAAMMPVALQIIESLWLQAGPLLNLALSELGFRTGQDHHRELLDALVKRNVKSARAAIEADIADAARIIRRFLDQRADGAAG